MSSRGMVECQSQERGREKTLHKVKDSEGSLTKVRTTFGFIVVSDARLEEARLPELGVGMR